MPRDPRESFELRRQRYERLGKCRDHKYKLFVAVPHRGAIHPETAAAIWRLVNLEHCDSDCEYTLTDVQQSTTDIVRVRNRMVDHFLHYTDATHLLFVDGDVGFTPKAVVGMLRAGRDFVACPYPRRDGVSWERFTKENIQEALDAGVPLEAIAYNYSVFPLETLRFEADGCAEVRYMPLGCALLSRAMCERMTGEYRVPLSYEDELLDGTKKPMVSLFQLMFANGGLLSEDYSFCERWRNIGGQVHMYLGEGSPVDHFGEMRYRGCVEAFGIRRG